MWKQIFGVITVAHAAILAAAAIGLFKFWVRTRFWLPKYIHVMAGIAFIIMFWAMSMAPADAPVNRWGFISRFFFSLLLPGIVYLFFIVYGGQHAAYRGSVATQDPCPFCGGPVATQPPGSSEITSETRFLEQQCPHCGQSLHR
jgi:hypothetical protein